MGIHLTKHLKPLNLHSGHIEVAVADYYGVRQNLIVPNVSWGFDIGHEADLIIVSRAGYATEIEIKTSKQDLLRDKNKRKWNGHTYGTEKIKGMFFAVPRSMKEFALEHIPEHCGLITVDENIQLHVNTVKGTTCRKGARKLTDKEMFQLARLGCMRIWSLKRVVYARDWQ